MSGRRDGEFCSSAPQSLWGRWLKRVFYFCAFDIAMILDSEMFRAIFGRRGMTDGVGVPSGGATSLLWRLAPGVKKLVSIWSERDHRKRYILGGAASVAGIWLLCIGYLSFMPKVYVSKWILILPGAGAGVSVSLESIGQTSSVAASPFSSPALSSQSYL